MASLIKNKQTYIHAIAQAVSDSKKQPLLCSEGTFMKINMG